MREKKRERDRERERERERWRGPATFGLSIEELIVESLNPRFLPYSPKKAKNPFFGGILISRKNEIPE
jgi:hypothetical protein